MSYTKKDSLQKKTINSKRSKHKLTKLISLALIFSFFISSIITPFFAHTSSAATADITAKTKTYLNVSAMKSCLSGVTDMGRIDGLHDGWLHDYIDESNASSGLWFTEGSWTTKEAERIVGFANSDTGKKSCNSILSEIKTELGYSNYTGSGGLLCDLMNKAGLKRENGTTCETGNGKFKEIYKLADAFDALANEKLYGNGGIALDDAGWYVMYLSAFKKGCGANPASDQSMPESDTIYLNVNTVGDDKKKSGTNYEGLSKSTSVPIRTDLGSKLLINMKCSDVASNINNYVDAYVSYLKLNPEEPVSTDGSSTSSGETGDQKTTCAIDGVGWIVCPVMNFLATITDTAFDFLATNLLETNPKTVSSSTESATYNAWKIMRDIANVVFVIAFLIIIFSQLSSFGIDNYGIKKLLPKIVIAAILVNLSFIICQVAVDISNILGYSLKSLFDGLGGYMKTPTSAAEGSKNILGGAVLMTGLLATGVTLALAVSIPVIVSALFALLVIVIILLARNALIVLLVVISPLAFVAYLLPNTEEYFTKWKKTFTALLLVFPVVSVVFGASSLAAGIVKATSANELGQVMALGVALIPLFVVPGLLKKSIDSVGNIGAKISGMGDSIGKRATDTGLVKHLEGRRLDTKNRISTGNYVGKGGNFNPRNWQSRANRKFNNSMVANKLTGGYGAQRDLVRQAQDQKDIKDTIDLFNGDDTFAAAWAESGGNKDSNAYRGLSDNQKIQFNKMVSAGYHNKSTSHLAAAQFLSQEGKGTGAQVANALQSARNNGANDGDVDSATHAAIAQYRKNGRADAYAELSRSAAANHVAGAKNISNDDAWGDIPPAQLNKAALATTQNQDSYRRFLESDSENTRRALASYDNMESIAAKLALPEIVYASKVHEYNKTGVAPTITTIQQAKDHFGVR